MAEYLESLIKRYLNLKLYFISLHMYLYFLFQHNVMRVQRVSLKGTYMTKITSNL